MLKVLSYNRGLKHTQLNLQGDDESRAIVMQLPDGILESYMGAYGMPAGAMLSVMIADALMDDMELPPYGDPDSVRLAHDIMYAAAAEIIWEVDRDELLAAVTLADDTAAMVRDTWEQVANEARSTPRAADVSKEEMLWSSSDRASALAGGHQRRQEELLAEEFVSARKEANTGTMSASGAIPMEFVNGELRRKE